MKCVCVWGGGEAVACPSLLKPPSIPAPPRNKRRSTLSIRDTWSGRQLMKRTHSFHVHTRSLMELVLILEYAARLHYRMPTCGYNVPRAEKWTRKSLLSSPSVPSSPPPLASRNGLFPLKIYFGVLMDSRPRAGKRKLKYGTVWYNLF